MPMSAAAGLTAGLTALLLLSACGGDGADPEAAPAESTTPTPSATSAAPTPTASASATTEAAPGQPITACPAAEEVAQALGLAEVLPQSDYAEIQKKAEEAGADPATSNADPGCAYGEEQSLSFQVFDASEFGNGDILLEGLKSSFDCAAGDCEVVTDEGGVYTVVFASDEAGRVLAAAANGQYACGFTFLVEGDDAAGQARETAERTETFLKDVCGA